MSSTPFSGVDRRSPVVLAGGGGLAVTVLCASAVVLWGRATVSAELRAGEVLLWQGLLWGSWGVLAAALLREAGGGGPGREVRRLYLAGVVAVPLHALLSAVLSGLFSPAGRLQSLGARWAERAPLDLLAYTALSAFVMAVWAEGRARATAALAADLQSALDAARDGAARLAPERLLVSVGPRQVPVDPSEVEWFGSAGNYVVVNWSGREGLLRGTLSALADGLDPAVFARVHRSTIANLSRVAEAATLSDGSWRLRMKSGAELVASRTYRDAVLSRLGRAVPPDPRPSAALDGTEREP